MALNRRQFISTLGASSAVLSIGSAIPGFLRRAAASASAGGQEKILVVLQLSGGNDGLNTVIPFRDEAYYQARPTLAVPVAEVAKLTDESGMHPAARGLADLFGDGKMTIVQGVGYDNPNRSHFESMDIWHSCFRKDQPRTTGWLGRGLDSLGSGQAQVPAIHVGREKQPLALTARDVSSPSINSPEQFRLQSDEQQLLKNTIAEVSHQHSSSNSDLLSFLQQSTATALSASDRIAAAMKEESSGVVYPEHELGQKFETIARLIAGGLDTRVYYAELDGFDTHSQQGPAHEALLGQWTSALSSFQRDLTKMGRDQDVVVFCFSEFGRRVAENASEGTDHGAAAPVYLVGSALQGGLLGEQPSLTDLEDGDLKFQIDFRRVYASLLDQWLEWDSQAALGEHYERLPLFA